MAIILVGANFLYGALAGRKHLLTGRAGELLYAAAFTEFADEWQLYEGQQSARFADEQLQLAVGAAQTAAWSTARHHFADFDARVNATASEGPIDNALGLVFRVQADDARTCDLPAVILCGIENIFPLVGAALRQVVDISSGNGYFAFLISSDGYYSLWKTDAGASKQISAWIPSPQINQGLNVANHIRVIGRASGYQFFINEKQASLCLPHDPLAASTYFGGECIDGSMKDTYQDESLTAGKLGVIAQSTASGGGGVVVHFDNMIVFSPEEPNAKDAKL